MSIEEKFEIDFESKLAFINIRTTEFFDIMEAIYIKKTITLKKAINIMIFFKNATIKNVIKNNMSKITVKQLNDEFLKCNKYIKTLCNINLK